MTDNTKDASEPPLDCCVGRILVCKVGGHDYYGNEYEFAAARLMEGDRVIFNGREEKVKFTWFYDGIIVDLESGAMISAATGDTFEVVPNTK